MQHATDTAPLTAPTFVSREQAAYAAIRDAIVGGRWRPGDPLAVSRIAQDLGISRVPVTNAVKRLATEGFLELRPHLEPVVGSLDPAVIREIYLMRGGLERIALEEASRRASAAGIATAHTLNDDLRRARDAQAPIPELRAIDRTFHRHLHELSGMPTLIQTLANLADRCEYYRVCILPQDARTMFNPTRHHDLLKSLTDHDVTTIGPLAERHIHEGLELIFLALNGEEGGGAFRTAAR